MLGSSPAPMGDLTQDPNFCIHPTARTHPPCWPRAGHLAGSAALVSSECQVIAISCPGPVVRLRRCIVFPDQC
jgi:hypothetical protein